MQKFFKFLIVPLSIYVIQFIIFPIICKNNTNDNTYIIFFTYVIPPIIIIFSLLKITNKFRYCLLTLPLYPILIFIYHPPLLFGIGGGVLSLFSTPTYDRNFAWFGILISTCLLLLIEFLTWILLKIILIIKEKKKRV